MATIQVIAQLVHLFLCNTRKRPSWNAGLAAQGGRIGCEGTRLGVAFGNGDFDGLAECSPLG